MRLFRTWSSFNPMGDFEECGANKPRARGDRPAALLVCAPNVHANLFAPPTMKAIPSRARCAYLQVRKMVRTAYSTWLAYFHGNPTYAIAKMRIALLSHALARQKPCTHASLVIAPAGLSFAYSSLEYISSLIFLLTAICLGYIIGTKSRDWKVYLLFVASLSLAGSTPAFFLQMPFELVL